MTITTPARAASHQRVTRVRCALAASCLAVAAAVAIPAGPASAAVCDGVSCNGQDPNVAGCAADAITPPGGTVQDQGVKLELRYSPSCHANWARITPARFNWHFTVYNDNGDKQDERALRNYDSYHTNMVNGNVKAWACFDDTVCTNHA